MLISLAWLLFGSKENLIVHGQPILLGCFAHEKQKKGPVVMRGAETCGFREFLFIFGNLVK